MKFQNIFAKSLNMKLLIRLFELAAITEQIEYTAHNSDVQLVKFIRETI